MLASRAMALQLISRFLSLLLSCPIATARSSRTSHPPNYIKKKKNLICNTTLVGLGLHRVTYRGACGPTLSSCMLSPHNPFSERVIGGYEAPSMVIARCLPSNRPRRGERGIVNAIQLHHHIHLVHS
jgi:hypothetical protein